LRRRIDDKRVRDTLADGEWIGDVAPGSTSLTGSTRGAVAAIEPPAPEPPPNIVTVAPGTKMADVERRGIEAALRETRGNRRRAAEMLGIGERTLYRKIKDFGLPDLDHLPE